MAGANAADAPASGLTGPRTHVTTFWAVAHRDTGEVLGRYASASEAAWAAGAAGPGWVPWFGEPPAAKASPFVEVAHRE
jgi:hypothetical protein